MNNHQQVLTPLGELQQKFAIIDLSGEIRVVNRQHVSDLQQGRPNQSLSLYKKGDADLMMQRFLESLPVKSQPREVIKNFWTSPATLFYEAIAFTPEKTPDTTLNFWVGPAVKPVPGSWVILRDFILNVVCAGEEHTYEYLIRYMAHMVQKPEEKPGVMIALLGGQGTGKGMYFRLLQAIWPCSTLMVSDIEQVIGRFNSCLERNYVICMDEALFAGDRKSMDRLKSIVTEPVLQIEQKHQPSRAIQSLHRIFAASNHAHFGNIENDDRRFVFLKVSDIYQKDTVYFSSIAQAINDPSTIGALLYYLSKKDLNTFNVRQKPNTALHVNQKIKSLTGFDRFWFEILTTGFLDGRQPSDSSILLGTSGLWFDAIFVPSFRLAESYREFNKSGQRHQTVQIAEIVERVKRLCPSATTGRQSCPVSSSHPAGQHRGLKLPDLATARREFEYFLGGELAWD